MMNQNVNETISFISKKSFVIVNSRKKKQELNNHNKLRSRYGLTLMTM